jgi:hypothetical protein
MNEQKNTQFTGTVPTNNENKQLKESSLAESKLDTIKPLMNLIIMLSLKLLSKTKKSRSSSKEKGQT